MHVPVYVPYKGKMSFHFYTMFETELSLRISLQSIQRKLLIIARRAEKCMKNRNETLTKRSDIYISLPKTLLILRKQKLSIIDTRTEDIYDVLLFNLRTCIITTPTKIDLLTLVAERSFFSRNHFRTITFLNPEKRSLYKPLYFCINIFFNTISCQMAMGGYSGSSK